jgi:signal transduction histidine kinase
LIDSKLAASVAFIAFGVNFFGAILLLLLNAGSRSVRWYLPFHSCVLLWLFSQGADLNWPNSGWTGPLAFSIAVMPYMFVVFAIMDASQRPAWHAYLMLALAAPFLPLVMDGIYNRNASAFADNFATAWSLFGWIGGSAFLWVHSRRQALREVEQSNVRKKTLLLSFVMIGPLSVVFAIVVSGQWFVAIGVPIITILIMFKIFYGVTRLQFYDIEVRARRTGDIAAETYETQRLAVLGELAATIAHEVRNPLTGVRSLAQRIATDDIAADKRRQYAEVILEETSRVEKLVSNLLDVAKRGAKARPAAHVQTRLAPVFADLTLLVAARAKHKGLTVNTLVDDALTANAPRELIAQAVLNLLLNAISYAPANSAIDLRAQAAPDGVEVIVRDRGAGVPAGERERIFAPFYSTRPDGTGLGLSVVRHLAREHGWRVSVSDAAGGGAEFQLVIP